MNHTAVPDPLASSEDSAPDIRVVSGNPSREELAAVTAVIVGLAGELSGPLPGTAPASPNGWSRSQRAIRKPVVHGRTLWRTFTN